MPALRQRASICTGSLNGRARRKGGAGAFCGSRCRAYSPGGGSSEEGCRGGQEAAVVRQFDEANRQVLEQVVVGTCAEERKHGEIERKSSQKGEEMKRLLGVYAERICLEEEAVERAA